ncbi:MAG: hypothetical protein ACD_10C00868G0001 [uncultured bacterium]|nr:MAG: hypothetical protein ACD_10C00868G0001 [uncultured bacterium]
MHGFGQCRMGVANTSQVFRSTTEFHRHDGFRNQFGGIGADNVHTKNAIGVLGCQHLDETGCIAHAQCATIGEEGNLAHLVGHAIGFELLLGFADPGDFRGGVDDPGNGVEIAMTGLTSHQLGNHDAFFVSLVRQHRSAHDVTDCPDTRQVGLAVTVNIDHAARIELEANRFGIQAIGIRHTANGDDQTIGIELLGVAIFIRVVDGNRLFRRLDVTNLDTHLDVQTLLGEQLVGLLGHINIGRGEEIRHGFKDGDFGTNTTPDRTHFQTDDASTDNGQLLRHGFLIQRAFIIHDDFLVDRQVWQVTGLGTGSDNDLLGEHLFSTNLDLPELAFLAHKRTVAGQESNLILFQQHFDAGGQLIDHAILARLHDRHVDRRLANFDALGFKAVPRLLEQVRGMQQGLRRNTANVQAGATKTRLTFRVSVGIGFGTSSRETELRSANRRNVATGTTTDNEHVKLLRHVKLRLGSRY